MEKVSFYNSLVDFVKSSGQGLIKSPLIDESVLNELIDDGLVKIVTKHFTHLPNDVTICLTKGYCVDEDCVNDNTEALTYIRMYLKHENLIELGDLYNLTLGGALQDLEIMEGYVKWLKKNKEKLDELKNIKHLSNELSGVSILPRDYIDRVKRKNWYKENCLISDCVKRSIDAKINDKKKIELYEKIIELQSDSSCNGKYDVELEKDKKTLKELKSDFRDKVNKWLSQQPLNAYIQDILV